MQLSQAVKDKDEPWSILKSDVDGYYSGWPDSFLNDAGKLTRSFNQSWPTYDGGNQPKVSEIVAGV